MRERSGMTPGSPKKTGNKGLHFTVMGKIEERACVHL